MLGCDEISSSDFRLRVVVVDDDVVVVVVVDVSGRTSFVDAVALPSGSSSVDADLPPLPQRLFVVVVVVPSSSVLLVTFFKEVGVDDFFCGQNLVEIEILFDEFCFHSWRLF